MGACTFAVVPTTAPWRTLICSRLPGILSGEAASSGSPLNSSECFNPWTHAWEVMNPMLRQRSGWRLKAAFWLLEAKGQDNMVASAGAVSAVLGRNFLVAGGGDGQQPLSILATNQELSFAAASRLSSSNLTPFRGSVERFSSDTSSWEDASSAQAVSTRTSPQRSNAAHAAQVLPAMAHRRIGAVSAVLAERWQLFRTSSLLGGHESQGGAPCGQM